MGFEVFVTVELRSPPKPAVMATLEDHFEAVTHASGSKVVTITEHMSVPSESDAIEFVRSLVLDAVPDGARITEITAIKD